MLNFSSFLIIFFLAFFFQLSISFISMSSSSPSLPVLFLSHGGGPSFFLSADENPMLKGIDADSAAAAWFRSLATDLGLVGDRRPSAIVIFSAHWETSDEIKITSREENPDLLYDYSGFPASTYSIKYPAPGSPSLAARILEKFSRFDLRASLETKRNFDHGVFVPLKLIYPNAEIPVVQISLLRSLDPATHLKIGEAISELRKENILIIGSGYATHAFGGLSSSQAKSFVGALDVALTQSNGNDRISSLINWTKFPHARAAHPREEHLVPLFVAVGAGGPESKGTKIYDFLGTELVFAFTCWKFE